MADYGVTDYGFVRKPYDKIFSDLITTFQSKLGNDFDVSDGSINQQFLATYADALDLSWQAAQGVYSSQTIQGAEGIYLDDLLSQQGVFREGKTKGGGQVLLLSNLATTTVGQTISSFSTVSNTNNIIYDVQDVVTIDGFGSTYSLAATQVASATTYNIVIYNINSPSSSMFTWTTGGGTDIDDMLLALSQYINTVIPDLEYPAYYNTTTRIMYVGYNQTTGLPAPLPSGELYVNVTPAVGLIGNIINVEARTEGFYPIAIQSMLALSPTYTGYSGVINWQQLSSGTEVQTDAEYRLAYQQSDNTSIANTEDSIRTAILNLEGTTACVVWENPTFEYVYDYSDKLVCPPYTYNVVVEGGNDDEIANTILVKMPLGVNQYGTTTVVVNDKTIRFTKAAKFPIALKIKYQTKDNTPLTEVQKNTLSDTYIELVNSLYIGDEIIATQFEAATYSVIPYNKVKSIVAEIKDLTISGGNYTSDSLIADHNERPQLLVNQILFERIPA